MINQSDAVKRAQQQDLEIQNPNSFEWLTSCEHDPEKRTYESF